MSKPQNGQAERQERLIGRMLEREKEQNFAALKLRNDTKNADIALELGYDGPMDPIEALRRHPWFGRRFPDLGFAFALYRTLLDRILTPTGEPFSWWGGSPRRLAEDLKSVTGIAWRRFPVEYGPPDPCIVAMLGAIGWSVGGRWGWCEPVVETISDMTPARHTEILGGMRVELVRREAEEGPIVPRDHGPPEVRDDELDKPILSGAVDVARAIYNEAFREADTKLTFDEGE